MGFIGTNPPAARVTQDGADSETRLSTTVDATPQNMPGHVAFFKDSNGRISVLRYVQAQASIALGATLMRQAGGATTLNSAGVSTLAGRDPAFVDTATTALGNLGGLFGGVAAAAVSNTGYYFWSYISGYCPSVALPTLYASGQALKLSATYAGRLSSAIANASNACTGGTLAQHIVAFSLGAAAVSTANSTNSCLLTGWFM